MVEEDTVHRFPDELLPSEEDERSEVSKASSREGRLHISHLKENEKLETPPLIRQPGHVALIIVVASMKSRPGRHSKYFNVIFIALQFSVEHDKIRKESSP